MKLSELKLKADAAAPYIALVEAIYSARSKALNVPESSDLFGPDEALLAAKIYAVAQDFVSWVADAEASGNLVENA